MQNLNRQMAHGAMWMGLLRICVRSIGIVSTVILARILVPEDFGVVAMATSIIAFLQLATAFNFDIPLIQKQDADRNYFDSAWTLNVIFYGSLTIVLVLLAEPAAAFYREPRLTDIIYVMAAGFFAQGFENIGIVYFRKELDFRKDFIHLLSKKIVGFAITIPLALWLRSYWALIAGMVIGNVFGVALTYYLHPFRPRFTLHAAGELFGFSKWLILNNVVNFLRTRSPDFVIGRISGTSALGLFTVAYEISTLPTTELVAPINRVVFPGYSKLAANPALLRQSYVDVLAVIALIALPAGFGLAAVATPLIDLFLGEKWSGAAPIVGVLAVYGGINAIQTNTGSVFNAIGKPYLITLIGALSMILLISASITLALQHGPLGVAAAYLLTTVSMAPVTYYFVCRETKLNGGELIRAIWVPLACSLAMYLSVAELSQWLSATTQSGPALQLAVLVPFGTLVYTSLTVMFWILRGRPDTAEYRIVRKLFARLARSLTGTQRPAS